MLDNVEDRLGVDHTFRNGASLYPNSSITHHVPSHVTVTSADFFDLIFSLVFFYLFDLFKDGMSPLLIAAFEGKVQVCEILLENNADMDHADKVVTDNLIDLLFC